MASIFAYPLRLRSPLHVGERGVGLEAARHFVPADTLFSALCSVWRLLYGVDALGRDVLARSSTERVGNRSSLAQRFPGRERYVSFHDPCTARRV